jgi:hypothetical protein
MVWYPYTGTIPFGLLWPSGIATTSLSLAALAMAGQLAWLALRAVRTRAVSVPRVATPLDQEQEVKQAAA